MSFRDILISQLGSPRANFGLGDALLCLAAIAILIMIELAFGRVIRRTIGKCMTKTPKPEDRD